jgi:hypothetical protein
VLSTQRSSTSINFCQFASFLPPSPFPTLSEIDVKVRSRTHFCHQDKLRAQENCFRELFETIYLQDTSLIQHSKTSFKPSWLQHLKEGLQTMLKSTMRLAMLCLLLFATLGAYVDATPTSLSNTTLRAVTSSMTDSYAPFPVPKIAKWCPKIFGHRICLRQAPEVLARQATVAMPKLSWQSTFILKGWEMVVLGGPWVYMLGHLLILGFGKWRQQRQQMKNMGGGGGGGDM